MKGVPPDVPDTVRVLPEIVPVKELLLGEV
jgi:hypothetical protein